MPSTKEHLNRAKNNYQFLKDAENALHLKGNYPEWYVTVMFYISVHVVDAYMAKVDNKHPGKHTEREDWLDAKLGPADLFVLSHRDLSKLSRVARYLSQSGSVTATPLLGTDIKDAEASLDEVKRFCKSNLGFTL